MNKPIRPVDRETARRGYEKCFISSPNPIGDMAQLLANVYNDSELRDLLQAASDALRSAGDSLDSAGRELNAQSAYNQAKLLGAYLNKTNLIDGASAQASGAGEPADANVYVADLSIMGEQHGGNVQPGKQGPCTDLSELVSTERLIAPDNLNADALKSVTAGSNPASPLPTQPALAEEVCPECEGHGAYDRLGQGGHGDVDSSECPTCNGRGLVPCFTAANMSHIEKTCSPCKGTGIKPTKKGSEG